MSPRYYLAWVLYRSGDAALRICDSAENERWARFWYRIYTRLMTASIAVQGNGAGPWGPALENKRKTEKVTPAG